MNTEEFETGLKTGGFDEITTVEKPPGYAMEEHSHPFDACALITEGAITLVIDGMATTYAAGDIFRLPAGTPHHECAGPNGVRYRVGRRAEAAPK